MITHEIMNNSLIFQEKILKKNSGKNFEKEIGKKNFVRTFS